MLRAVTTQDVWDDVLTSMAFAVSETICPVAILYFGRDESNGLNPQSVRVLSDAIKVSGDLERELHKWGEAACERGNVRVDLLDGAGGFTVVTVPVVMRGAPPSALSTIVISEQQPIDRTVLAMELFSAHLTLWHVLQAAAKSEDDARSAAALLELMAKIESQPSVERACFSLVNEVRSHLGCERVAVGLRTGSRKRIRLLAVSGLSQFDAKSDWARSVEAAFDETIIRDSLTLWPSPAHSQRHAALAHQRLSELSEKAAVASSPLRDAEGKVVGAWLFIFPRQQIDDPKTLTFIRASEVSVASCLDMMRRGERGPLARLLDSLSDRKGWKAKTLAAAALLMAAAMMLPMPYKVGCLCETQPVTRRIVAAPFDGTLEKSLVAPGDVVEAGKVIARMDGREIRWELASLEAELAGETKKRDAAMASRNVSEAQLAKLAMERVNLKMEWLNNRADNLEIKSPIRGVVISGELDRTEGAPLLVGQSLFEIAPLEQMVVEVGVPESDIAHVGVGMKVTLVLDAYPSRQWKGTVKTIHPRAEIKNDQTVFIADVILDNREGLLRPGMNGDAKIIGKNHPWGWNLFHKVWDSVALTMGW